MLAAMPGQPSPTSERSGECVHGEYCVELYDDPATSLVVPCFSPNNGIEQVDYAATEEDTNGGNSGSPIGEEEIVDDWNPSLYMLQVNAPKPKLISCQKKIEKKPSYYGEEFHGVMTREEVSVLLGNEDGTYLVTQNHTHGDYVLSFMLDGRMWNYRLFYEEGMHFVGDNRFDQLEELVEDGLITLFMRKHINITQAIETGKTLTRKKTMKLRRKPCRRRKSPRSSQRSQTSPESDAQSDCRRSPSTEPFSPEQNEQSPKQSRSPDMETQIGFLDFGSPEPSDTPPRTYFNFIKTSSPPHFHKAWSAEPCSPLSIGSVEGDNSAPLTPNSNAVQSDLDFIASPTTRGPSGQRRSVPDTVRLRTSALDTKSFADKRAKSVSALNKLVHTLHSTHTASTESLQDKARYSPIQALRDVVRAERATLVRSMDLSELAGSPIKNKAHTLGTGSPMYEKSNSHDPFTVRPSSYHSSGSFDKCGPVPKVQQRHELVKRSSSDLPYPYYKAHSFKVHTYKSPTWCEVCHHFLWGLKHQGLQCRDCGMDLHRQCVVTGMRQECKPTKKMIRKVYGVDLTTLLKLEGHKIPAVMRECVHEMETRDPDVGIQSEGIYRVSGHTTEILELKEKYDMGEQVDFSQYRDVNIITGAVKLFLRDLPIPIISFDAYSQIIKATAAMDNTNDPNPDWQPLVNALKLLPKAHYNVLKYLAEHLHRIDEYSAENKMTAYNLAVVFAPTLMRAPHDDLALMKDFPIQRNLVEYLIKHYSKLFD